MRMLGGALLILLLAGAGPAQPPTGPAPPADSNDRLDAILLKVEQRMKDVEAVHIEKCVRTDRDRTGEKHWEGEVRYLRPNLFALSLVQREDRKFYELIISTGKHLYEYRPQFKKLVVHELPPAQPGMPNNGLLSLMFCQSSADAKRRYDFKITKDLGKDNSGLVFLEITPKSKEDKREFTRAELVLADATGLPRRLWFEHPNGSSVQWDFVELSTTKRLTAKDFTPPALPAGWERVEQRLAAEPEAGAPRVIRSGADK